jgi:hypothetical protein
MARSYLDAPFKSWLVSWILAPLNRLLAFQLRAVAQQSPPLPEVRMSAGETINFNDSLRDLPHEWVEALVQHLQNVRTIFVASIIDYATGLRSLAFRCARRPISETANFKPMNPATCLSLAIK